VFYMFLWRCVLLIIKINKVVSSTNYCLYFQIYYTLKELVVDWQEKELDVMLIESL